MFTSEIIKDTIETLEQDSGKESLPVYVKVQYSEDIEEIYPVDAIGSNQKCIIISVGSKLLMPSEIEELDEDNDGFIERTTI